MDFAETGWLETDPLWRHGVTGLTHDCDGIGPISLLALSWDTWDLYFIF